MRGKCSESRDAYALIKVNSCSTFVLSEQEEEEARRLQSTAAESDTFTHGDCSESGRCSVHSSQEEPKIKMLFPY